jgi:hypothetical protein
MHCSRLVTLHFQDPRGIFSFQAPVKRTRGKLRLALDNYAKIVMCNRNEKHDGDACNFAHSIEELVHQIHGPTWKTKRCENVEGGCEWNPMCDFNHNETITPLSLPNEFAVFSEQGCLISKFFELQITTFNSSPRIEPHEKLGVKYAFTVPLPFLAPNENVCVGSHSLNEEK